MKILVFGASGMIGSAMFRVLSATETLEVFGTLRSRVDVGFFPAQLQPRLLPDIDVAVPEVMEKLVLTVNPEVIVNCIGLTKHHPEGNEALAAISMNALLPHRIAKLCQLSGARLIHISTDCVFSGAKGAYTEEDLPDAMDIYGRSKQLGEVIGGKSVTLRTSTIGHELRSSYGLLEWFLSQTECFGYTRTIFSGVPSVVLAQIVREKIIPNRSLSGLFHVAGPAIAKANLLTLIAKIYGHKIVISYVDGLILDRSLDSTKLMVATGYRSMSWSAMVQIMHNDFVGNKH